MIARLALASLRHRPWRSLFLLLGYGVGVGVMIVLLAIGQAMLSQARDERLVGGGQVTVLPEGIDLELMKTGGVGGMFFSIDHARFVYRQLLASPRLAPQIAAAAPQVEGTLLYLRAGDSLYPVRASGEIPSLSRAVGAVPPVIAGAWDDDSADVAWRDPTPAQLAAQIDHFHLPPPETEHPESWAEWHYFNVLSADHKRWAFVSVIVGGNVRSDRWGGEVLVTLREEGGRTRRFSAVVPAAQVRFSTDDANLRIGTSSVTVLPDGRYRVHARAGSEAGGSERTGVVEVDLTITPRSGAYFPGASLAGGNEVSGYAVPALVADGDGQICVDGRCERLQGVQAYHDHNWGTWQGVTWEWGAARAGQFGILYGRVHSADTAADEPPLVVYVVDSLGFRALFRPREVRYTDTRTIIVDGRRVRVPASALLEDARGGDTLRLALTIDDAIGTDTRRSTLERGDPARERRLRTPYFIQMKGRAHVTGTLGGQRIDATGWGFFETFR
ncbi:MAG TPA: hypothetical protein VFK13_10120 [Gemmatimonadaceae bacterium]|nr:hypothetical protein [Gemmatimonadaceae bacterium]